MTIEHIEDNKPVEEKSKRERKTKPKEETLSYQENELTTQALKNLGLPTCKVCGSGFRTNLKGEKFCPNHKEDCPMLML
jgi:hypothetical protein